MTETTENKLLDEDYRFAVLTQDGKMYYISWENTSKGYEREVAAGSFDACKAALRLLNLP